jgi:hypothetical protein
MKLEFIKGDDGWTLVRRKQRRISPEQMVLDDKATGCASVLRKFPWEMKKEFCAEGSSKSTKRATKPSHRTIIDSDFNHFVSAIEIPWVPCGSRRNVRKMSMWRLGNYVSTKKGPGRFTYGTFGDFGV